ncbi:MAG: Alkaline phosphatase [Rhizobium sp.]|nr:Alkaline phosphatase [Rhizobium sp.]
MSMKSGRNRHVLDDEHSLDAAAKALPIYSIEQISAYLTKGYWQDANGWGARSWTDKSITFDIAALSPERQVLAEMAFAAWGEISGLDFSKFGGGSGFGDIEFAMEPAAPTGESTAWETDNAFSGKVISMAQIHIAANFDGDTKINSTAFESFMHEIGHALGLGHAGNYNGTGGGGSHYQNDTRQFSIMSYGAQGSFGGASSLDVLTPQMADIHAIIKKYGAAAVRETDTTYGFNASGLTTATGFVYDFENFGPAQEDGFHGIAPAITIVDTGGKDTLDLSGYFFDQRIDLRGGKFSDAGQFKGNVGIYLTSVIENAVGGEGKDYIGGNKVANSLTGGEGEDTLCALQGNDRLTGGIDADTFVYRAKFDRDTILDFEDGVDKIDLGAFDFSKFGKVFKLAKEAGDDLVISFGHGDKLVVEDFSKAEFTVTDVLI